MIEQTFLDFGYTKQEYDSIKPHISNYTEETILKNFKAVNDFLSTKKYKKSEIKNAALKLKTLYTLTPESLQIKINKVLELGYFSELEVIGMIKDVPQIFSYNVETMSKKINFFISKGIDSSKVIKFTSKCPSIFTLSIDNCSNKYDELIKYGFLPQQLNKAIVNRPQILTYDVELIKQKIDAIQELGYTKEQAIKIVSSCSDLLGYNIETIKEKFNFLLSLNFTKEEVIKMTIELPQILTYSKENVSQKINFYTSIGLRDFIIDNAKQLMQSTEITSARYKVIVSKDGILNKDNQKALFLPDDRFKKMYDYSKQELLEKFSNKENKDARII